jgi:hypothetical protein
VGLFRWECGAHYTQFFNDLSQFDNYVKWDAVTAAYWSDPAIKEKKQAEFLVFGSFPWSSVLAIGVIRLATCGESRSGH